MFWNADVADDADYFCKDAAPSVRQVKRCAAFGYIALLALSDATSSGV
jgi:hypothetical protein